MSSDYTRVRNTENMLGMLGRKEGDPVPTAGCPTCKTPLIGTFAFSKAEFYCLECGRTCGWLDPYKLDAEEVAEQMEALQAEWDEHAGSKLMPTSAFWRNDCDQCKDAPTHGHWEHVTEEEIAADKEAREWLKARASRG